MIRRPNPTKTPGVKYFVYFTVEGVYQVVSVSEDQGVRMRARGVTHVYDSSTQAHAVRRRLEKGPKII